MEVWGEGDFKKINKKLGCYYVYFFISKNK